MEIELIINDVAYRREVHPAMRLLDFLREELHLIGTKEGCGQGECGACSVILNSKLVNSCLIPVGQINGAKIITVENQDQVLLQRIKRSFEDHGAVQCGFCTPGMILAAFDLLRKKPQPTREEIKIAISGNLCRCTGYTKIIEAILAVK